MNCGDCRFFVPQDEFQVGVPKDIGLCVYNAPLPHIRSNLDGMLQIGKDEDEKPIMVPAYEIGWPATRTTLLCSKWEDKDLDPDE